MRQKPIVVCVIYIPMLGEVESCLHHIIDTRNTCATEYEVDGVSGFLLLDRDGKATVENHWAKYFQHALERYNATFKQELLKITPHVCRHTLYRIWLEQECLQ